MNYFWALFGVAMAGHIGWSLQEFYADWSRRRHAKWVTVRMANGVVLQARVEDVDWGKFFEVEERVYDVTQD